MNTIKFLIKNEWDDYSTYDLPHHNVKELLRKQSEGKFLTAVEKLVVSNYEYHQRLKNKRKHRKS